MKPKIIFIFLSILLIFTLIFSEAVWGLAVGVIPDKLVFEGDENSLRIVNPNGLDVEFSISSDNIPCTPQKGNIGPNSSADIVCVSAGSSQGESIILVETSVKGDGDNVGVLPAVAVRAIVPGNPDQIEEKNKKKLNGPLAIGAPEKQEEKNPLWEMKTELTTIAILIIAIISVMIYPEIKKIRKKKPNSALSGENKDPRPTKGQSTHQDCGPHES